MPKTLILFDFDGTIADTKSIAFKAYQVIAKHYGIEMESEAQMNALNQLSIKDRLKAYNVPLYKVPTLIKKSSEILHETIQEAQIFEGMEALLRTLKAKGHTIAIVSSNRKSIIEAFLNSHQLDIFDALIGKAPMFKKEKSIKKMMKHFHAKKHETIYIGDEVRDIEASKRLGIDVLGVAWGYDAQSLLKASAPNNLFDTVDDLTKYLLTL